MHQKRESVLSFEWNDNGLPKVVRDYRAKYKLLSQVLDEHAEILDAVHEDLKKLSSPNRNGREGDYTTENILRALVLMSVEGLPYRESAILMGGCDFLQDFVRLRKKPVMDFSFLNKCFLAIRPETWRKINLLLGRSAVAAKAIDPDVIRTDTTLIEANIHYPTDSALLWDSWRVGSRELKKAREIAEKLAPYRFHDRKMKNLHLFVTRYAVSKSKSWQRRVKQCYRRLIERTERMVRIVEEFCKKAGNHADFDLLGAVAELEGYLPTMRRITAQARRAREKIESGWVAPRRSSVPMCRINMNVNHPDKLNCLGCHVNR